MKRGNWNKIAVLGGRCKLY